MNRILRSRRMGWVSRAGIALALAGVAAMAGAVERWQSIGPEGGIVVGLAFDAAGPRTLYAAVEEGGVFRSDDAAATWTPARSGLPAGTIRCLAADPAHPGTLYVGRGFDGVWRSVDGGRTWAAAAHFGTGAATDVRALLVDPEEPSTIFAGLFAPPGQASLWKSDDAGAHWAPLSLPVAGAQVTSLATTSGVLFAGLRLGGVLRSVDGGGSWERPLATADVRALAAVAGRVYAATAAGLQRSRDLGRSWSAGIAGLVNTSLSSVAVRPDAPGELYVGSRAHFDNRTGAFIPGGVAKSVDGGRKFTAASIEFEYFSPLALAATAHGGPVYAAPEFLGVWSSRNGGVTWADSNRGLRAAYVTSVLADPQRPSILYAGVTPFGLMRSRDAGATWRVVGPAGVLFRPLALEFDHPATLYALGFGGGGSGQTLFKSSNGGGRWTPLTLPGGDSPSAFAMDPTDPRRIFVSGDLESLTVHRSPDGGANWESTFLGCLFPQLLTVAAPNDVFAGGFPVCTGSGGGANAVERSDDGARTFSSASDGLPPQPFASVLAADPRAPATLYLEAGGLEGHGSNVAKVHGVFRSTDGALHWSRVPALLGLAAFATDFAFPRDAPDQVWLASAGQGILVSPDSGVSWSADEAPLPTAQITDLAFSGASPEALYAATPGGLYRRVRE